MEGDQPKKAAGRGGRGALILQALQNMARQPCQAGALPLQPAPIVPPSIKVGGAGVQTKSDSGAQDIVGKSPSGIQCSSGRGALISQLMKKYPTTVEEERPPPSTGAISRLGRGKSDLLKALKVGGMTTKPGADPIHPESSEGHSKVSPLAESMQHLDITAVEKPVVSKQGTAGSKFMAAANWIRLSIESQKAIFEYEVKFEPAIDARNLRFKIVNSQRDKIGYVKNFDGVKLWLPMKLANEITVLHATHPVTNENVLLKVVYKMRTPMDQCLQFYNVLFGRIMRILKMAKVGYNYYSPGGSILVPQHKLEIWPGYVTGVHYMEGGLMLMLDVSHRVLHTDTCYDAMSNIYRSNKGNFKDLVVKELIGSVVLTRYNNRTYRIDDIIFDQNPQSTFAGHDGQEVRFVDYYKTMYGIELKDTKQPLLLHRITKKEQKDMGITKALCLIPELCYLTGLKDEMRADFRVMKDLAQYTRVTPDARQVAIRTFIRNVNESEEARKALSDWGLTLEDNTLSFDGRTLPPEKIYFRNKEIPGKENADFSREACREAVISPVDLKPRCWLIMFSPRDEQKCLKFVETLRQVTRSMGIQVGEPSVVRLQNDRTESYVASLKEYYHDKIAVIIFPVQREDRYSAVKRLACVDLGLPTQCINSRTISQEAKLRSVTQKIALQINCKLGGELWAVKIPMSGLMVCGVDVYHDPTRKGSSVVGFVASLNNDLTRWFSQSSFQHPGNEIINGLKISLLEALRKYHTLHHTLPRTIIIFRDGVSDGQLKIVEQHEVPQVASIFQNFDAYEPKLSYVVVQKRLNTRIFAVMNGRTKNPPPGSIVDSNITRRDWYDFLLVSQDVRQGTVSPTYYIVVHDSTNLKVDNMQKLSYKLTHLYYNWPGTVRVPAPCQYAHKLAYLVGQNIRKEPAVELNDKLYFL